jgi:hypothetical protein
MHSYQVLLEIVQTRPQFGAAAASRFTCMNCFFMSVQVVSGCEGFPAFSTNTGPDIGGSARSQSLMIALHLNPAVLRWRQICDESRLASTSQTHHCDHLVFPQIPLYQATLIHLRAVLLVSLRITSTRLLYLARKSWFIAMRLTTSASGRSSLIYSLVMVALCLSHSASPATQRAALSAMLTMMMMLLLLL